MVHFTGRWCAARVVVTFLCVSATSSEAIAQTVSMQTTRSQIGFVGGASIDPEQAFAGVFWETPEIGNRFHLRPGIDGGFGSDVSLATINVDFIAKFRLGSSGWKFIQGGGPAIVIAKFDTANGERGTDVGAGGSYIIGFAHDSGFLGEFRIGAGGNVPSLKLAAGFGILF
jgi:hypothetical protein